MAPPRYWAQAVAELGEGILEDRSAWGQPNGTWRVSYLNSARSAIRTSGRRHSREMCRC
jgi:hypothetical protein